MCARWFAGVALALTVSFAAQAQSHSVHELAPGVYVWQGDRDNREPANCTWVIFKDYVVVVDANFPWGAREIVSKIKNTTDKPIRFVFVTHYHADHSFGISTFADLGASIISSQATGEELREKGPKSWTNWNNPQHSLEGARFVPSNIMFSDRMVFDDGMQRLELIKVGPGHTAGDAVAWLPKQKIVATGDLCVTWAFGNNVADADGDYENWLHALDQMISWNPTIVIPGHGAPSTGQALRVEREYLSDMLTQVRAGKAAGKSADELARTIDLSKHGMIANDAAANATSIRAMYRRLDAK
ncbi:MAG TPA: MBL fold metallo-hydrolase [Bryobacteraceae bacterium]|nr:MBL fold metallo-hydrolase [Bryobacteraceae bacterium]